MSSSATFTAPTGWIHIVGISSGLVGSRLYINGVLDKSAGDPKLNLDLAGRGRTC